MIIAQPSKWISVGKGTDTIQKRNITQQDDWCKVIENTCGSNPIIINIFRWGNVRYHDLLTIVCNFLTVGQDQSRILQANDFHSIFKILQEKKKENEHKRRRRRKMMMTTQMEMIRKSLSFCVWTAECKNRSGWLINPRPHPSEDPSQGGPTAAKQKGRCTTSQHIPPTVWTYWVTIYAVVVVAEIYSFFFFQVTCTIPNGWTVKPKSLKSLAFPSCSFFFYILFYFCSPTSFSFLSFGEQ